MKKIKLLTLLFSIILLYSCNPTEISNYGEDHDFSIMSFNIRFNTDEDGENKWDNRKEACLTMLEETTPTILCIQEGLNDQVTFFDNNLPDFNYVGVGRDDSLTSGEYSAIFYSINRFELLETGNFWLSETPNTPSLGWDANNIRIVTWAKLNDLEKNKTIYVFNTHFDHKGKTAQEESSKLLAQKIEEIAEEDGLIFITGDFNMLVGSSRLKPITEKYFSANDTAERSDNNKSFNGWGRWYINRNIDFIFYQKAEVLSYKTVVKDYGVPYISDHYPIIAHFDYE